MYEFFNYDIECQDQMENLINYVSSRRISTENAELND